jgi:multidrug efflux system outer membrane protein
VSAGSRRTIPVLAAAALALAPGCAVGPDYEKPKMEAPAAFSEAGPWKAAEPRDSLPREGWWRVFDDPVLNSLEDRAVGASPTLAAALARYDQALAAARVTSASLYPSLSVQASADRQLYPRERQSEFPATTFSYTSNSFNLPLVLNYEVDVFGQARRAAESARASAEAQGSLYRGVLLTLESGVAQNYFTLRSLVTQRGLLQENVALLRDALDLVLKLRRGGANSDLDVYQAKAQLATVEAGELAAEQAIAEQTHALAVLVGERPEGFSVEARPLDAQVPAVPVGLPSDLLERRPDVAAAERSLAAANARIGVAKGAFFPSIGLTALAGANSSALNNLLTGNSAQWAVAPFVALPLFSGGANLANYREAQAAYREALADYRSQVLAAFQQVEDGLSDLRLLEGQSEALERAAAASGSASSLSLVRYKAGLVSYIEVIDSQRTQLQSELSLAQARAGRLSATVLLVRALGGGW